MALVPGYSGLQKSDGACLAFTLRNLTEGETGVVINKDVDELPTDPPGITQTVPIPCDTMPHTIELAQFFDVDMDHLAGPVALISDHRFGRLKVSPTVQPMAHQYAPHGRPGETRMSAMRSQVRFCLRSDTTCASDMAGVRAGLASGREERS